jgi:hypothetical protein
MQQTWEVTKMDSKELNDRLQLEQAYLEGKMKRYGLLFSVNGGAFAIITLVTQNADGSINTTSPFIGKLTLQHVAAWIIVFTALMIADIWRYGTGMRGLEARSWLFGRNPRLFTPFGQLITFLVGILLVGAWSLAFFDIFAAPILGSVVWMAIVAYVDPNLGCALKGWRDVFSRAG